MGPVAGPQQYRGHVCGDSEAQADGARLIAGGDAAESRRRPARATSSARRCLPASSPRWVCFSDEIFGPVLAVCEFGSLDEALEMANNSIYGLSSAIFTKDLRRGEDIH